jgi:MoaA/NifB/PqqE/SkfB family radical SAM enzyme
MDEQMLTARNFELPLRFIDNWLRIKLFGGRLVRPVILSYFVTFRCNLRCSFCDYTDPLFRSRYPEVSTGSAIRLLEIARQGIPSLAISGGEPLLRDDIVEILRAAHEFAYKPIALFTNSLLLEEREDVLDYVDFLQISLDTADEHCGESDNGHRGVTAKVKENIRRYAKAQKQKRFRMNVNCVLSEDHLDDARGVLEFAESQNVTFTVAPRLIGERPAPALVWNKRYQALVGDIIARKRKSPTIMDTLGYLRHIHSFLPFKCYPWLTPRVYPNGQLMYPCPVLNYSSYDILQMQSWEALENAVFETHGTEVTCERQCFLPCYLEASTVFSNIFSSAMDVSRLTREVRK